MFWIVMEDQPQTCTSRWHLTEEEAVREAIRLARKERHKFFVLKVVKSIEIEKAPVCIAVYDHLDINNITQNLISVNYSTGRRTQSRPRNVCGYHQISRRHCFRMARTQ